MKKKGELGTKDGCDCKILTNLTVLQRDTLKDANGGPTPGDGGQKLKEQFLDLTRWALEDHTEKI